MTRAIGRFGVLLRIMCAIAFVCVGFAHKPLVQTPQITGDLAQYTLPDGTLPVLCLPTDDGHSKTDHGLGSGCEACRLTATSLVPTPTDIHGSPILRELVFEVVAPSESTYRQLFPPNSSPRGPPSSV